MTKDSQAITTRERAFRAGFSQGYREGLKDLERYNFQGKGASMKQREDAAWKKFKTK
jgi:hypothetical protein